MEQEWNTQKQNERRNRRKKRRRKKLLARAVIIGLAGICVFQAMIILERGLYLKESEVLSVPSHRAKIAFLEDLIEREYLEEVDEEELAEGMYAGLLYGLGDPYSRYYTAEEYEQEMEQTDGEYVGIGVLMQLLEDGSIQIAECYKGSPGEEAGIQQGDILTAVNGKSVEGMELAEVSSMIKDSEQDSVTVTVIHKNTSEPVDLAVPIRDVELTYVFHEMLEDKVGYIQITQFTGVTYKQYQAAFDELKEQGMERLVIDLRENPGGLVTSVCDILEQILPEGIIVYTEDKNGNREEKLCDGKHPLDMPLAVLVNENSASASEIFAGAVQDYKVGTIVGTTTYGKGIVQTIHPINDGSAVKLTVAKYYTPNGNYIHEKGITPDVEVPLDENLRNLDEVPKEQDNQLQKAIEIVKNK